MPTHVNYDNIRDLLYSVAQNLKDKINAIDLTQTQKDMLIKIDKIIKTGTGTSFLSDNGTYKNIPLDKIQTMVDNLGVIYNLLKISTVPEQWNNSGILSLPSNRGYTDGVLYNNKIYIIGGTTADNASSSINTTNIYDLLTNTWSTGRSCTTARARHASVLYNGKIYIIGGWNTSGNSISTVEIYDIISNTWTTGANIPVNISAFGYQLYNGKIYCIGGYNGTYLNKVEVYDILSNTWSTNYNNMPSAKAYFKCALYNDNIYCIAGYYNDNVLNTNYIYNISTGIWTSGTAMITSRSDYNVVVYNNKFYYLGGYTNSSPASTKIEIYNPYTNTWSTDVNAMPTNRSVFMIILYNNKIYCIGGWKGAGIMTNSIDVLHLAHQSYNLDLPTDIATKLSILITNGVGTKLLTDNGTYQEYIPSGYREMSSDELNTLITGIKSIMD